MKIQSCVLFLVASYGQNANAFVSNRSSQPSIVQRFMASSDDGTAKAFTDYMAKSHEEKLKALKDLEDQKNSEIQALKDELNTVKEGGQIVASSPTVEPAPIVEGSVEDLSAKLAAYQKFMADYIVKAQLEKYEAVKAAEASISKKYEDKLNAFMLNGSAAPAAADDKLSLPSTATKLFEQRSANLAAAAKAGKSRWGSQEIEKVSGIVVEKITPATPTAIANPPPDASPEAIKAADHGLRADGGVGGLTLQERVVSGSNAKANGVPVVSSGASSLYAKRNARIAEAAKAGKSRWGSKEVAKVLAYAPITILTSPEVEAADHGLRADGGVSGPSLAERVNLGAQLLQ